MGKGEKSTFGYIRMTFKNKDKDTKENEPTYQETRATLSIGSQLYPSKQKENGDNFRVSRVVFYTQLNCLGSVRVERAHSQTLKSQAKIQRKISLNAVFLQIL